MVHFTSFGHVPAMAPGLVSSQERVIKRNFETPSVTAHVVVIRDVVVAVMVVVVVVVVAVMVVVVVVMAVIIDVVINDDDVAVATFSTHFATNETRS